MTTLMRLNDSDGNKKAILDIQDSYTVHVRGFIQFLDNKGLDLTIESLVEYRDHLKQKRVKANTLNKRLSACKNRLRYLFYRSNDALDTTKTFIFEQALKSIKGKKNSKAVDKESLPSPDEIKLLMNDIKFNCQDLRTLSDKLPLWIEFLMCTGARVSEAINIRIDKDLKEKGNYIEVKLDGKGDKERTIKVDPDLISRIHSIFKGRIYLFETGTGRAYHRTYVSNQIKKAGRRVLKTEISAHSLRHIFASTALKKGWSPKKIAEALGHSKTSTTLDMYCHDLPTYSDYRELYD